MELKDLIQIQLLLSQLIEDSNVANDQKEFKKIISIINSAIDSYHSNNQAEYIQLVTMLMESLNSWMEFSHRNAKR